MPKLALAILFVLGIKKYATIQQCAVHVTNHSSNVPKRRGLASESATFCSAHVPAKERGKRASANRSKIVLTLLWRRPMIRSCLRWPSNKRRAEALLR